MIIEIIQAIIFGIVDNGILILGGTTGIAVDIHLNKFKGLGCLIGSAAGNAVSDLVAGLLSWQFILAFGTFFGCFIPLAVYILIKWLKLRKNNID